MFIHGSEQCDPARQPYGTCATRLQQRVSKVCGYLRLKLPGLDEWIQLILRVVCISEWCCRVNESLNFGLFRFHGIWKTISSFIAHGYPLSVATLNTSCGICLFGEPETCPGNKKQKYMEHPHALLEDYLFAMFNYTGIGLIANSAFNFLSKRDLLENCLIWMKWAVLMGFGLCCFENFGEPSLISVTISWAFTAGLYTYLEIFEWYVLLTEEHRKYTMCVKPVVSKNGPRKILTGREAKDLNMNNECEYKQRACAEVHAIAMQLEQAPGVDIQKNAVFAVGFEEDEGKQKQLTICPPCHSCQQLPGYLLSIRENFLRHILEGLTSNVQNVRPNAAIDPFSGRLAVSILRIFYFTFMPVVVSALASEFIETPLFLCWQLCAPAGFLYGFITECIHYEEDYNQSKGVYYKLQQQCKKTSILISTPVRQVNQVLGIPSCLDQSVIFYMLTSLLIASSLTDGIMRNVYCYVPSLYGCIILTAFISNGWHTENQPGESDHNQPADHLPLDSHTAGASSSAEYDRERGSFYSAALYGIYNHPAHMSHTGTFFVLNGLRNYYFDRSFVDDWLPVFAMSTLFTCVSIGFVGQHYYERRFAEPLTRQLLSPSFYNTYIKKFTEHSVISKEIMNSLFYAVRLTALNYLWIREVPNLVCFASIHFVSSLLRSVLQFEWNKRETELIVQTSNTAETEIKSLIELANKLDEEEHRKKAMRDPSALMKRRNPLVPKVVSGVRNVKSDEIHTGANFNHRKDVLQLTMSTEEAEHAACVSETLVLDLPMQHLYISKMQVENKLNVHRKSRILQSKQQGENDN